jgi:ABC-2 type transport system permease protein
MEAYLFTSSVREFLRFRRIAIWIVLAFAGMGLAILWPHLDDSSKTDQYTNVSAILVFHLLPLASAIFTTAVVSQEVEQKTIVYLLTRPVLRWKLIVMRFIASACVVAALGILSAVAVSFGVYGAGFLSNPLLPKDCIALVFGALSYGALFLLISLLFNRAMIICLLFAFGWETSVPNMPGEMYQLSINSQLQAIAEHPSTSDSKPLGLVSGTLSTNLITASSAYVTLTLLTVILVSVSALWFTRFEYVPREDAE